MNLIAFRALCICTVFLVISVLPGCSIPDPLLEQIKNRGELVVLTRNSPTTYYEDKDGFKGLEYELVSLFADSLGVKVRWVIPSSMKEILPMVARGEADFAAAGLSPTKNRGMKVKFTPGYQQITQQLVYRGGSRRPRSIDQATDGTIEIVAGSNHEETLQALKKKHPKLHWKAQHELDSEELLYLVKEQVIDYTVADSNVLSLSRRFYPEVKKAFDLTEPKSLAWAFPHAEDNSLFDAARDFLESVKQNGILDQIIERYYGHVEKLGFVDTRTFRRHIAKRLPAYIQYFKAAEKETGIDWQLLAAVGYQESHWDTKAVSPTGVKGIMMLTQATAKQLDIKNRLNPQQSIIGGARYLRLMEKKLPERVEEPDRMWLALAGYNIGFGHLEDARILTQRNGGDPDKWADVKQYLPLLSQEQHYSTLKHGYARGREPVIYVDNIRSYHDLLVWENSQRQPKKKRNTNNLPLLTAPAPL